MQMSLLRGVQTSALGGADASAARGRLPLPPSCLASLRYRLLLLFVSFFLLFLLRGALGSRFSAYPTAAAETRPASARERDAHHLASPRPRLRMFGAVVDAPGREKSPDAIDLARFAVAEHNSKTNAALVFVRLVKVRLQLVAGILNYFTIEVRGVDGGGNKMYEARVWLKPRSREKINLKELITFEPVANAD